MKFAFATALLAVAQVQATEIEGSSLGHGYDGYSHAGHAAVLTISKAYTPVSYYNGHGHHSYSSHSSSSYSSYSSSDYSSEDYGYGYKHYHGRHRYYRYAPKYNSGRYYYGKKYASHSGHYKAAYKGYKVRSYSACWGCARPANYW